MKRLFENKQPLFSWEGEICMNDLKQKCGWSQAFRLLLAHVAGSDSS